MMATTAILVMVKDCCDDADGDGDDDDSGGIGVGVSRPRANHTHCGRSGCTIVALEVVPLLVTTVVVPLCRCGCGENILNLD